MTVRLLSLPWLEPRQAPLGLAIVQRHISDIPVDSKTYHPNIDFYLWISERYGPAAAEFAYSHDEVGEIVCGLLWRALSNTDFSRAQTRGDILRTIAGLDPCPADDSMPAIEDALEASDFRRNSSGLSRMNFVHSLRTTSVGISSNSVRLSDSR